MLGVYTSGKSGAHINPAVTLANCVFRKFPWRKFPVYLVAQTLGGFVASGVVYANYKSAIDAFEGGANIRTVPGFSNTSSAGIFCTYPAPFMTRTGMFFSEFIASAILMFCIYALKDDANIGAGNLTPLGLFFVIFGIGKLARCSFGLVYRGVGLTFGDRRLLWLGNRLCDEPCSRLRT
jgi:aquaglyceroporin related protein, other eukaryote